MKNHILQNHTFPVRLCIFLIISCILFAGCGKKDTDVFISADTDAASEVDTESSRDPEDTRESDTLVIDGTETAVATVFIYVCGAVTHPDVYELPAGSRICDAITAAGGMTDDAAADYWNQAEILTDGEMIYIPTRSEAEERVQSERAAEEAAEEEDDGKININTATKAELMTISGIGEGRAENIIKYREANGSFEKPEDITNVSGIGDSLYESMKDSIKVD